MSNLSRKSMNGMEVGCFTTLQSDCPRVQSHVARYISTYVRQHLIFDLKLQVMSDSSPVGVKIPTFDKTLGALFIGSNIATM